MGIAMGLPSTMLGITYLVNILIEKKIVSETTGYILMGVVITYMFYLMIRFANEKRD